MPDHGHRSGCSCRMRRRSVRYRLGWRSARAAQAAVAALAVWRGQVRPGICHVQPGNGDTNAAPLSSSAQMRVTAADPGPRPPCGSLRRRKRPDRGPVLAANGMPHQYNVRSFRPKLPGAARARPGIPTGTDFQPVAGWAPREGQHRFSAENIGNAVRRVDVLRVRIELPARRACGELDSGNHGG